LVKGKKEKAKQGKEKEKEEIWKKKLIFWDLPYWRELDIRRCLDGMHIIKNICESLLGLLLNTNLNLTVGSGASSSVGSPTKKNIRRTNPKPLISSFFFGIKL
jgi:hypothetical protein